MGRVGGFGEEKRGQVHMCKKKKKLHKTILPKKVQSCTYSGLEKIFWQDVLFSELTH